MNRSAVFFIMILSIYSRYVSAQDGLISYPKKIGEITKETSEIQLENSYGKENMVRKALSKGDGAYSCATVLFQNTEKEIAIFWSNAEVSENSSDDNKLCSKTVIFSNPEFVRISRTYDEELQSKKERYWKTAEGIYVGINLLKLEELNKAPINFESSDSCFDGGINSWNGGKIEKLSGLFEYSRLTYPSVDLEDIRGTSLTGGDISSHTLAPSIKKRIYLSELEFSFLQDGLQRSEPVTSNRDTELN
jgi:hypothetical protein